MRQVSNFPACDGPKEIESRVQFSSAEVDDLRLINEIKLSFKRLFARNHSSHEPYAQQEKDSTTPLLPTLMDFGNTFIYHRQFGTIAVCVTWQAESSDLPAPRKTI